MHDFEHLAGSAAGIDRRSFLRTTAGGSAAIALASLLPSGVAADYPQAVADGVALQGLTPKEYATVRAAAEAFLVGVPVPPAKVAQRIDREIGLIGEPIKKDMKSVLMLIEHGTILSGHISQFTSLPLNTRLAVLNDWRDSRFELRRSVFGAIKSFVYFYGYSDNATRGITKFEGPWTERTKIPAYPVDFGPIA
jgi:hypothetical protein